MRTRYRYDHETGEVVEIRMGDNGGPPLDPLPTGPHVISDTMDAMRHPCNGQWYDSKSKFRAETRARGCTEVGNEKIPERVDRSLPGGLRDDLRRAYSEVNLRS